MIASTIAQPPPVKTGERKQRDESAAVVALPTVRSFLPLVFFSAVVAFIGGLTFASTVGGDRGRSDRGCTHPEMVSTTAQPPPVTTEREKQQGGESVAVKALPILLPLFAPILFAAVVALIRNAYVRFYSEYGITPEDVGLEQPQVLSALFRFCLAAPFLRSYMLLKLFALISVLVVLYLGVTHYCTDSNRLQRNVPATYQRVLIALGMYAITILLFVIGSSLVVLPRDRELAAGRIATLQSVRPNDLGFLMIQAHPAHVIANAAKGSASVVALPPIDSEVMYLGVANGTAVVHDPKKRVTWRVPEGVVTIRVAPS